MHKALREPRKYPIPFAYMLSRLTEEFHCLPSEAYREWLTAPVGLLEEVLEARTYAALVRQWEACKTAKDADEFRAQSETAALVETIGMELQAEDMKGDDEPDD